MTLDESQNSLPDKITKIFTEEKELMEKIIKYQENYRVIGITPKTDNTYEITAVKESLILKNYKALSLIKGSYFAWLTLDGYKKLTPDEETELYIKGFEIFCKTYNCK